MRKGTIDKLLDELNAVKGLKSRDIGYSYFADVRGDGGPPRRKVYTIINAGGGVSYSVLNCKSKNKTAALIRAQIADYPNRKQES